MSIKNILVHFNGTEATGRAVCLAAALARRYDAHLTGVFVHALPHAQAQYDMYLTAAALDILQHSAEETEAHIEAEFHNLVQTEEQAVRANFVCVPGMPNDVMSRLGRTYDLVVLGQPDKGSSIYNDAYPDDVAIRSGRPVLIAPRGFERLEASGHAILAWDGQRAASRALSDAMDLLEDQQRVMVLHVGKEDEIRKPGEDVMEHLSRHGLDATLNVQQAGGISTSDIILNTCAQTDAGLLVMGAYEHSRFSEMILGGVTRDVVARSHIPVLMSH
jgi:nucleotide-binding universal stress UspA family protein